MSRTVKSYDPPRAPVWSAKDTNEVLDYSVDFSPRLGCDTISSVSFSLTTAAGLTIASSEHDSNKTATVWLTGGTEGSNGKILCRAVSTDGRTMDQTVKLPVRAR